MRGGRRSGTQDLRGIGTEHVAKVEHGRVAVAQTNADGSICGPRHDHGQLRRRSPASLKARAAADAHGHVHCELPPVVQVTARLPPAGRHPLRHVLRSPPPLSACQVGSFSWSLDENVSIPGYPWAYKTTSSASSPTEHTAL